MTKAEKKLVWELLFSLRHAFDNNGKVVEEYYQNIILTDLTKSQKQLYDNLINYKL
jgi:hypothetical protein